MGDTKMNDGDHLDDYNEVGQDGKPLEDTPLYWSFDDEQKAQAQEFQAKYGDEIYYEPFTPKLPRGSVEDIQHRLRITGVRLRKDLNRSLLFDPQAWTALRRPASIHTAQRTLAEMLMSIPSADQEHFHELGDGYVYMPLQPWKSTSTLCAPVQGTARAVPQYRWQYRTKVDFEHRLSVMFAI